MVAKRKPKLDEFKKQTVRSLNRARVRVVARSNEMADVVHKEVKKNPWKYLGLAALTSVVFGFLFGRKSK